MEYSALPSGHTQLISPIRCASLSSIQLATQAPAPHLIENEDDGEDENDQSPIPYPPPAPIPKRSDADRKITAGDT